MTLNELGISLQKPASYSLATHHPAKSVDIAQECAYICSVLNVPQ